MYNLNYAPTTLGYKVEKIYLGVLERKRLNIIGLEHKRPDGKWIAIVDI